MTVKDLQRITDRGQVYLFIPEQQNLHIPLNLKHLLVRCEELELAECAPDDRRLWGSWDVYYHISKLSSLDSPRLPRRGPPGRVADIEVRPSRPLRLARHARRSRAPGYRRPSGWSLE